MDLPSKAFGGGILKGLPTGLSAAFRSDFCHMAEFGECPFVLTLAQRHWYSGLNTARSNVVLSFVVIELAFRQWRPVH